jgi:hypothetical protein
MPRSWLLALLLLTACGSEQEASQPLTPLQIRSQLFEHMVEATDPQGGRYFIRFHRGNTAEIISNTSEFARWYPDVDKGLCLQLHDDPPRCAPLYQTNPSHYQWGGTMFSDLTVRSPDVYQDRNGLHAFPETFFPAH